MARVARRRQPWRIELELETYIDIFKHIMPTNESQFTSFDYTTKGNMQARGFRHWILGTADLEEPIEIPTHLPYEFTDPDEHGRVPFPDVVLASGYEWAMHHLNGYPFHLFRNNNPHISNEEAVARCMLWPQIHATYGAQRFVNQSHEDLNKGTVYAGLWRSSIARYLYKESALTVTWNDEPPVINLTRNIHPDALSSRVWDIVDVDVYNDGRAQPLEKTAQSSLAMVAVFGALKNPAWAQRLFTL